MQGPAAILNQILTASQRSLSGVDVDSSPSSPTSPAENESRPPLDLEDDGPPSDDPYDEPQRRDDDPMGDDGSSSTSSESPESKSESSDDDEEGSPPPVPPAPSESELRMRTKLAELQRSAADQSETLASVLTEMAAMKSEHDREERRLVHENADLRSKCADLEERLTKMESDMDDRHAMSEYAAVVREASLRGGGVVDSTYVVRLKSQLCRALHQMGVLHDQAELATKQKNERTAELRSKLSDEQESKSKLEMEFMNDLFVMERDASEMRDEYEDRLAKLYATVAELQMDLDLSRESKRDAVSYARHTREQGERRRARKYARAAARATPEEVRERGGVEIEEELNDVSPEETEIRRLRKALAEREGTERLLREQLEAKSKTISQLQTAAQKTLLESAEKTTTGKTSSSLGVDLKTLNYQSSQYARANGIGAAAPSVAPAERKRMGMAARTA